jgi:hypothetical protein
MAEGKDCFLFCCLYNSVQSGSFKILVYSDVSVVVLGAIFCFEITLVLFVDYKGSFVG